MILHPGVLASLVGSLCVLLLVSISSWHAAAIVRKWDFDSSSAEQLALERRTYLVSTVVAYGLGFQLLSAFLFVHTVDDLHTLLVGAMCATGALNANPIGWGALGLKIVLLFASALWLVLNGVDRGAEDLPLCRGKFALLLVLAPLVAADFLLQTYYFLGLHPDVITSCCGSLFTPAGAGLASTLSALPPLPTLRVFYGSFAVFYCLCALCLSRPSGAARYALAALSVWVLGVSGVAVVSAISLYIYETPTHHCPFDFLQASYHYVGYPIYSSLALGVFFGALPGTFEPLKRIPSLTARLDRLQRRWVLLSILCLTVFLTLVSYAVLASNLTLRGSP